MFNNISISLDKIVITVIVLFVLYNLNNSSKNNSSKNNSNVVEKLDVSTKPILNYVKTIEIRRTNGKDIPIDFAELAIFDENDNNLLTIPKINKTIYASSMEAANHFKNLIDGDYNTKFVSGGSKNDFVKITLDNNYKFSKLFLVTRRDCCTENPKTCCKDRAIDLQITLSGQDLNKNNVSTAMVITDMRDVYVWRFNENGLITNMDYVCKQNKVVKKQNGHVQCLSYDGVNCIKFNNNEECNKHLQNNYTPYTCKNNDYIDPKHWCYQANMELDGLR